jgi:hypothetical protein
MASRTKDEWSVLQNAFTAPKFKSPAGDALTVYAIPTFSSS